MVKTITALIIFSHRFFAFVCVHLCGESHQEMDGLCPLMGFEFAVTSEAKRHQSWYPGERLRCFEESAKIERSWIAWIQWNKEIKDEHPVLDLDLIFLSGEERTDNYGFLQIMAQEAGVIFGADETAPVSVLPEQFPDRRYGANEGSGSREHSR